MMNQLPSPTPDMQIMARLILTNNIPPDFDELEFWEPPELVQWFHMRGYTLYKRLYYEGVASSWTVPALPFDEVVQGHYPYAYHDARPINAGVTEVPCAQRSIRKVVLAQDSQLRHVAIKLILDNSEEYRILRFLHEQKLDTLRDHCIIPVLDLLPFEGFWFAVMPRWGTVVTHPKTHNMREILHIMHSMLKGLAFLHAHNILHRDIKMENVLINHFADDVVSFDYDGTSREDLRHQGKLSYALMDFDVSIMVPRDIRKEEYRRPYIDSSVGSGNKSFDTMQGEFDYNPFAYDVGNMGVEFCRQYQHYSRHIPMLAPLLDKMTARDIENRFTAAEALQFLEEMRSDLTEAELNVEEYQHPDNAILYDEYDRWRDFRQKWASYRQPPTPFMTRVLRVICCSEYLPHYFIPSIRWFFFKACSFPQSLWTRLSEEPENEGFPRSSNSPQ